MDSDATELHRGIVLQSPRSLPAGRGSAWIGGGWELFKRAPWIWVAITLVYLLLAMASSAIPLAPLAFNLLLPVFTAGLMVGCRTQDRGGELQVAHLFAGFQQRTGVLVAAGALYMGLVLAVMLVMGLLGLLVGVIGSGADGATPETRVLLLLGMLFAASLMLPVVMAFYFAPALLVFHQELGVVEAFKLSFRGCLVNVVPFLVFGLVAFVLSILAVIPFMLGLLVLFPCLFGAIYLAYKEIFLESGVVND